MADNELGKIADAIADAADAFVDAVEAADTDAGPNAEAENKAGSEGDTTSYEAKADASFGASYKGEVLELSASADACVSAIAEQSFQIGPSYSANASGAKFALSAGLSDTNVYGASSDIVFYRGKAWQNVPRVSKFANDLCREAMFKTTLSTAICRWEKQLGYRISLRNEVYKIPVEDGEFGGDDSVIGGSCLTVSAAKGVKTPINKLPLAFGMASALKTVRTLVQLCPLSKGLIENWGSQHIATTVAVSAYSMSIIVMPFIISMSSMKCVQKGLADKQGYSYWGPNGYGAPNKRGIRIDVAGTVGNGFCANSLAGTVELKSKSNAIEQASLKLVPNTGIEINAIKDCLFSVGSSASIKLEESGQILVKAGNSEMSISQSSISLKNGQSAIKMTSAAAQANGSQVAGGVVSNCSFTFTNGTAMI